MAEKTGTRRMAITEMQKLFPGMEIERGGGDMVVLSKMCSDGRKAEVEITDLWHFSDSFHYNNPAQPYFDVNEVVADASGIDFNGVTTKLLFGWAEEIAPQRDGDPVTLKITLTTPTAATEIFVISEYDTRPDELLQQYCGVDATKRNGRTEAEVRQLDRRLVREFIKVPDEDSGADGYEHGYDFWALGIEHAFLEEFRSGLEAEETKRNQAGAEWMQRFRDSQKVVRQKLEAMINVYDVSTLHATCRVRSQINYLLIKLSNAQRQGYFVFPYETKYLFALGEFLGTVRRDGLVALLPEDKNQGIVRLELADKDTVDIYWYNDAALRGTIIF